MLTDDIALRWIEALIPSPWKPIFQRIFWDCDRHCPANETTAALLQFLTNEYMAETEGSGPPIYPPRDEIFRAFWETAPQEVRVVLLGQDPYHEPKQAQGLSFSVPNEIKAPPSLRNIFKERMQDIGISEEGASPCLLPWAKQGVLLLNTTLTVRKGVAGSHRKHGWESFTDRILEELDAFPSPMVFLLWGTDARRKRALLHNPAHLILESEHPSPLSAWRGFFGSRPFSQINRYLEQHFLPPICWET